MKFARTDKDILLGNPRAVELLDGSRVLSYALTVDELNKFLPIFLEVFNFEKDNRIIKNLVNCGTDLEKIRNFLIEYIEFEYIDNKLVLKPDLINFYWALMQIRNNTEIIEKIEIKDTWDTLCIIIEQNQLIYILSNILDSPLHYTKQTYTTAFNVFEIIETNLVPNLTLINWEEKLTYEQRIFYSDLVDQKRKKQIEINYLAVAKAISSNFNDKDKIPLSDILWQPSPEEEKEAIEKKLFNFTEKNRKNYMKENYTGNRESDSIWLLSYFADSPHVNLERFFIKEELVNLV